MTMNMQNLKLLCEQKPLSHLPGARVTICRGREKAIAVMPPARDIGQRHLRIEHSSPLAKRVLHPLCLQGNY